MNLADWAFSRHPLENLLVVSALLFCAGLYTVMTRRNAVSILMGIEMILNAANLNFVAFSQLLPGRGIDGGVVVIFVILLAAAEAAVALAIIIGIYQNFGRADVDSADLMKE